jgi:hypothetical protein
VAEAAEVAAEVVVGDFVEEVAEVGDLTLLSRLARGEEDAGDEGRGVAPSPPGITGGVPERRPKNESSPPWPFFLSVTGAFSFFVSTMRHPGGNKSGSATTSGRLLTDASHAVEPLVAL